MSTVEKMHYTGQPRKMIEIEKNKEFFQKELSYLLIFT